MKHFSYLLLISLLGLVCCQPAREEVYFIPTLHGLHKTNEKYNYDSLRQLIARIDPAVIAVEIRPEDIGRDTTYLGKNYPYEMWKMQSWFPQAKIVGFDWLGGDIENLPIPENYWQELAEVKKRERELAKDSVYSAQRAECAPLVEERLQILKNSSLQEILKSRDALLTQRYYECVEGKLRGSKYEWLLNFYDKRNGKLLANIKRIINDHKSQTMVIVTGDDHYVDLKNRFEHKDLFEE